LNEKRPENIAIETPALSHEKGGNPGAAHGFYPYSSRRNDPRRPKNKSGEWPVGAQGFM